VSQLATLLPSEPKVYPQSFDFSPHPRDVNHAVSYFCRLFFSLRALFLVRVVCFQYLADSFYENRGVGVSPRQLQAFGASLPRVSKERYPKKRRIDAEFAQFWCTHKQL
jgi:hypothetical protein